MAVTEFQALSDALARVGALGEPAELHGQLCGMACSLGGEAALPWVAELIADSDISQPRKEAAAAELHALAAHALEALARGDMSLRLALPDDQAPMDDRAASLGFWCQGFMHGLSQGAPRPAALESGVVEEIIQDFVEISQAELGAGETLAEAEEAYAELVEFVRVSAQLVFEELHAERGDDAGTRH